MKVPIANDNHSTRSTRAEIMAHIMGRICEAEREVLFVDLFVMVREDIGASEETIASDFEAALFLLLRAGVVTSMHFDEARCEATFRATTRLWRSEYLEAFMSAPVFEGPEAA